VAGIVVFGTEVEDVTVPVDEARPGEIGEDPNDIFGTTIKTTAAVMIRTIKIPAMILTGTFPAPLGGGGEETIGGITGSCPTDAEG
jgi:hypothetical protein